MTTSEFDSVKQRLEMIENNVKLNDKNGNRPTLRKRTGQNKGGSTTTSSPSDTSSTGSSTDSSSSGSDDSGPPTLKRRPDDGENN